MRPSIKDVDFSFEAAAKEREQLRNPRRTTVTSHDPDATPRKAPWKVINTPAVESAWTIERHDGKPTVFVENKPCAHLQVIDRITGNPSTSVYKMRILEACCIAAQSAEPGDIVTAFAGTAADFIGSGRVEVIEETRHGK